MSKAEEKLRQDLVILEAMAAEMDEYLRSEVLFWPMSKSTLPRLTLGGYLLRQHRLTSLPELLDGEEQARLEIAIGNFSEALVSKVVRFEQRAHQELPARLRQWGATIKDLRRESMAAGDYYASSVEPRAMIAALVDKLQMPPYELKTDVRKELTAYDNALRRLWRSGDFVWPPEWQPAYPKSDFWWLYGRPYSRS